MSGLGARVATPKRYGHVVRLLVALAAALAVVPDGEVRAQSAAALPCGLEPGPMRAVTAVLDGETVRLDDGAHVRLIGAMAPRPTDAGVVDVALPWSPETDAREALAKLVGGQSVALTFAGPRADRHGRVLAHLFVTRDGVDIWVQGRLVETGMARAYALPKSDGCIAQLLEREKAARTSGAGLWSHAAYQIRPGDRPTELAPYRYTFQIVRGRVAQGRASRGVSMIELASSEVATADATPPSRRIFRVIWRNQAARRLALQRPEDFAGKSVLVRGWIDIFRGPEIEITTAGQLEIEE